MFSKSYSYEKDRGMLFTWLRWQYLESPRLLIKIVGNFLRFNLSFFSFSLLLKTLFHPWRKYQESYGRGFDPKRFFSALSFNAISRVLGVIIRILVITIGGISTLFLFLLGLAAFILWILSPVLIFAGLVLGFYLILGFYPIFQFL